MAKIVLLDELPIRLASRGEWLHGDRPLHPRVAALFSRSLVPQPDGTYEIRLGAARHPVEVADTAFFVQRTELHTDDVGALQAVVLHLSDGRHEPLDPSSLMQGTSGTFYCRIVRSGRAVPCRMTAAQYHELALHCEANGAQVALRLGGALWPIAPYAPASLPLS